MSEHDLIIGGQCPHGMFWAECSKCNGQSQPTTKTPRTDAEETKLGLWNTEFGDFARTLELENRELSKQVNEMKEWCKAQRHLYDMAISNQESWMRKWDISQAELTQLKAAGEELVKEQKGRNCCYGISVSATHSDNCGMGKALTNWQKLMETMK